ncbi:MAG: hypothetical protein COV48_10755 [Elusimicrobia bacterium CG11_big_fil_rev_8_21_14_0_20_64_6]|nr:MAG: hypothetical protein COV48_10755 [Elusimicrobia bacterium CG11_big_fil_rev_8_21_14_0_20_64_6]
MVRAIDPTSKAEVELVAARMRETLVEVLGKGKGSSMYAMDWLVQRVLFHLDPAKCTGQVYVCENHDGRIVGHTMVRIEETAEGRKFGLFSTTYVERESRNQAVASRLLEQGERWMSEHGLNEAATFTDDANTKLIRLYRKHGYKIVEAFKNERMIKISKALT